MRIQVASPAFKEGKMIPSKYTCDGEDISPRLILESVPDGTKSIALINDDPDAPMGTWVHWVLYNLPGDTKDLPENITAIPTLPNGARNGTNSWGRLGYGGPCPPSGTHRYYFKFYALDIMLDLDSGATKEQVLKALENHILAEGQLMGTYQRQ
jgi:Raf kinase inhibitor-like YbhB/YbcL family protein